MWEFFECQVFDEMPLRRWLGFKFNSEPFSYRVSYRDGVMEQEPKPCAAVKGTQIAVQAASFIVA